MDDIEELPVETVAGERPAGAAGDRLLIGLAGLALLGGLMIAAGNFLSGFLPESASEASTTPRPSLAEPSRTARPTPTEEPLRELGILPGAPPEEEQPPVGPPAVYWLEALEPLPVYPSNGGQGEPSGRLAAGAVAAAEDQVSAGGKGWLFVYAPDTSGWVRTVDERGNALAILHEMEQPRFPSTVVALAAGPDGFVAHGRLYGHGWEPGRALTLSSADGARWLPTEGVLDPGFGPLSAAWGPSGWLAATTVQWPWPQRTWIWESATGDAWAPVGELNVSEESYVKQLVASDLGYLLAFGLGTPELSSLWYSPDGLVWQESVDPFASVPGSEYPEDNVRLAAGPNGFLAWRLSQRRATGVVAAFSRDGRTWTPIELSGDSAAWIQLAPIGESVIGMGQDADGATRVYEASLDVEAADAIQLVRAPHLDLAFDEAGVWTLVSDGTSAYAFGYEQSGMRDVVWRGDGQSWRRIAAPSDGFNEPVRLAAAGPAGVVALGARPNGLMPDPVLWHLGAEGDWVRQVGTAFPSMPPVERDECGEPPDSALEFMGLDPTVAVPCFGSRPLSFTAWSTEACDGCSGGGPFRGGSWLADPEHTLFLLPMEGAPSSFGGWREVVLGPDLAWRDEYVGAWLRITGHYDDPASEGCARPPEPGEELYYPGPMGEVSFCRQRFVITSATVVEGLGS